MTTRRQIMTPGMAATGVLGAFLGAAVGHFLSGVVIGAVFLEFFDAVSALREIVAVTAVFGLPVIVVVGLPVAVVLEAVMRGRPPMTVQVAVYGLTGAVLGLGYLAALGALTPGGMVENLALPILMGGGAAIGGKAGAERWRART